ncbi:MAG TPA: class I SAM-dependent methyltransferase [Dehalococcoidia bacterium]|jgi:ubiquinone/menaquinone biosynthesis C-methylase UbiE|nr:class I SAM-dependent methyltransferase [Dehalococcoidia bacterium]
MGNPKYDFSSFSELDFYKKVNTRLIELAEVDKLAKIIELGCGTGGVTELILDRVNSAKNTVIYAIDSSASAISSSLSRLESRKEAILKFIQTEAQNLQSTVKDQVDSVIYCNSIHYINNKMDMINQIGKSLKSGGTFAFNTSFYSGSHPPETEIFLRKWMFKTIRLLKQRYGIMPVKKGKVESRVQLTPENYTELVLSNGFYIKDKEVIEVDVPLDGWYHICSFRDWIEGVLPGVPLSKGKEILQETVKDLFDEMNIKTLQRNWLSVVAVKK